MALGDGSQWNETLPSNSTVANEIDDYDRDLRVGVRSRMAIEHVWPDTQTATSQAGQHNYITFQALTGAPSVTAGMGGVLYATSGGGLLFASSGGGTVTLISSGGGKPGRTLMWYVDGAVATGARQSARIRMPVAGTFTAAYAYLDVSNTGAALLADINKNGTTIYTTQANRVTIADGSTGGASGAITVSTFTAGDLYSLDIDQVGSAVAGSDLTVQIDFTEV